MLHVSRVSGDMDISHFPEPPTPWPRRISRDLEILLLSMVFAFCLWFGGGWLLASQISTAGDLAVDAGEPVLIVGSGPSASLPERRGLTSRIPDATLAPCPR